MQLSSVNAASFDIQTIIPRCTGLGVTSCCCQGLLARAALHTVAQKTTMMRRAACSLLPSLERLVLTSSYATQAPDYSLAMKKAAELSDSFVRPLDKEIGLCAGVPMETFKRPARIFVSARSPSQQGFAKTAHTSSKAPQWRIAFDTTQKWENHLIGWTSTADTLENVARASLFFYTKEEAMAFCDKYGWEYTVDMPNERSTNRQKRFNAYGDNFSTKRKGIPELSHLATHENY